MSPSATSTRPTRLSLSLYLYHAPAAAAAAAAVAAAAAAVVVVVVVVVNSTSDSGIVSVSDFHQTPITRKCLGSLSKETYTYTMTRHHLSTKTERRGANSLSLKVTLPRPALHLYPDTPAWIPVRVLAPAPRPFKPSPSIVRRGCRAIKASSAMSTATMVVVTRQE